MREGEGRGRIRVGVWNSSVSLKGDEGSVSVFAAAVKTLSPFGRCSQLKEAEGCQGAAYRGDSGRFGDVTSRIN